MLLMVMPISVLAEAYGITVTKADGTEAVEGEYSNLTVNNGVYAWDDRILYIVENDLIITGSDISEAGCRISECG